MKGLEGGGGRQVLTRLKQRRKRRKGRCNTGGKQIEYERECGAKGARMQE